MFVIIMCLHFFIFYLFKVNHLSFGMPLTLSSYGSTHKSDTKYKTKHNEMRILQSILCGFCCVPSFFTSLESPQSTTTMYIESLRWSNSMNRKRGIWTSKDNFLINYTHDLMTSWIEEFIDRKWNWQSFKLKLQNCAAELFLSVFISLRNIN